LASLTQICPLQAQTPPSAASMSAEVTQSYTAVKNNILRSADKMPAEGYSFKPSSDVRSFAEVLDHVAEAQLHVCAGVAGDPQPSRMDSKTAKSDVIAALNAAFAECDKAYGSLSDANAGEAIATPRGHRSKLGLLADNTGHDREQYGILTVYLRLKGIVPPSSEKPAGH
jgi:acyl-homoserine lactone acylase PvdQ